jgi:hypothetical protein
LAGWLIPGAVVALFLIALSAIARRNTRRMIERTLAARPNPTESQFLAMLESDDIRAEVAQFVWQVAAPCVAPDLTPHPDDHMWLDLPIDEEEPLMDWWVEFAALHGVAKDWPGWPDGWECSVRNYARWLELGLQKAG